MDKNSKASRAKDNNKNNNKIKTPTPPAPDDNNDNMKPQGTKGGDKEKKHPPESYAEHPEDPEKVVSRAERRRLIKEELQKTAQGEERGYYQRRLW